MGLPDYLSRVRSKNLHTWLPGYARHRMRLARAPRSFGTKHLLFALCDHFEPLWGTVSVDHGMDRVKRWAKGYPRLAREFRDGNGRAPRHSFFFPGEQYHPEFLEPLATLAKEGFGEVELHLHHEDDTVEGLCADIERYLKAFAKHGHLSRSGDRLRYAFIHGNWCLANARKDGKYCGVDSEVSLLWDTGCYADFTFPAAPNESQPKMVNQIFWPTGDLRRRRAYEDGEPARVGDRYRDRVLFIEGPLALSWRPGSLSPRIENGDLQGSDPPSAERLDSWVKQGISIEGRPEWIFVKVHTHGAPEKNVNALLGPAAYDFHKALTEQYNDGTDWKLHYVTAREMFNVAVAAMAGKQGDPSDYFDYELTPPPVAV